MEDPWDGPGQSFVPVAVHGGDSKYVWGLGERGQRVAAGRRGVVDPLLGLLTQENACGTPLRVPL